MFHTLFRQVDNSPLILFRIAFGLLLVVEAWGAIMTGWVREAFVVPAHTFPFIDFSWLQPLPGDGMYYYYIIMGFAGVMVMLGFYYRLGICLYGMMWTGVYLMQKTHYNNHYYLMVLLCALMLIVPAHRYASLDARRMPPLKSLTCPQWCIWIFVAQITLVYIYASFAKMYPDWLAAKPIGIWFANKSDYFLIGTLLDQRWFQYATSYGGILFDLLIAPGLLWKKTRKYAFMAAVFFHLFNSFVFHIGVFPYMGIAISVFFFNPETIRRIFFRRKPVFNSAPTIPLSVDPHERNESILYQRAVVFIFSIYFLIQLLLPLRHWLFPGNVHWTEEGHRLSWHMMLRLKAGYISFKVVDHQSKKDWLISPQGYVTPKQSRAIATKPDMCWQFVQMLKEDFAQKGYPDVNIYARGKASLNGREMQPLYNDTVNLAKIEWKRFEHAGWLVPLE